MPTLSPISHESLKERLHIGPVKFFFRKVGGDLRPAFGTTDLNRIPSSGQPKGGAKPPGVTPFFDLEKNMWRSVAHSQEIWIENTLN